MIIVNRDRLCPDGVKIAEKFDAELLRECGTYANWADMSNYLRCHIAWCEACAAMQKE